MVLNAMSLALGYILSTGALQTTPPPIKDPIGELESRRQTAERSANEIQAKGAESGQAVREVYEAAAKAHNAWLDGVCQRIEAGKGADDALDALAKTASDAFTAWYMVRAKVLSQPVHPSTASILDVYTARLLKTSAAALFSTQTGEASQRTAEARQRLTWKVWEQIAGG